MSNKNLKGEEPAEDYSDAYKAMYDYQVKRAKKALFEKHSIDSEIKDYNIFIRSFCWVKTFICLLLKRTGGSYLDKHTVCILSYDESSGYESQSWDAVWVSTKLFSGWHVCLASDGT